MQTTHALKQQPLLLTQAAVARLILLAAWQTLTNNKQTQKNTAEMCSVEWGRNRFRLTSHTQSAKSGLDVTKNRVSVYYRVKSAVVVAAGSKTLTQREQKAFRLSMQSKVWREEREREKTKKQL